MMLSRDQSKAGDSKANMGTLPYMPWEQISGAPASPFDDIYAVGTTIYELITGRPPFYDGGFEQIKVQIREMIPPSMEKRILDLGLHMPPPPDAWEEVAAACLAKRPEDRPQSMRAVAAALGFQSGSNTELEAKVSVQSERINELETQIISLSTSTAPVNREAEAQLLAATQQVAALQQECSRAQDGIHSLEAMLASARTREAEVEARLQATSAERDAALQGGDSALQKFQEESARRIARAEDNLSKLQQELDAARSSGDGLVQQARQAAQQKITELEAALQKARKDAEQVVQTATEKMRREADQLAERLKKAEESKDKAINQAREEGEKRLQKQAEELETSRQALAKVVTQKDQLERAVATEKERQGASLRPLLVGLVVAMVLGLGGGLGMQALKPKPVDTVKETLEKHLTELPAVDGQPADKPVAFDLFECFAIARGTTAEALGGKKGADGAVYGVNGITAMNFCNWLTTQSRLLPNPPLPADCRYALPGFDDLKGGKVGEGHQEWSKSWATPADDLVLKMIDGKDVAYPVHVSYADLSGKWFTFRLMREKISELKP